jgi:hypothetical protein
VRIICLLLIIESFLNACYSQSLNYRNLFGEDWKKAEAFEKENRSWIEPLLDKNQISYPLAISIIFPELVRYSALQDKMEITLLKALYINFGEDYADFSIGVFQMKPSFAETIRAMAPADTGKGSGIIVHNESDFKDKKEFRKSIIEDLEDPKSQLNYLIAFIKICEKKFEISNQDEQTEIRFLATVYNAGINKTTEEIGEMMNKRFFSTKIIQTENYSYSDVALYWYNQYMSNK